MFSIPFQVEKSIEIGKPPSDVYAAVADFKTWPAWSPWLCQEPDCPVEIQGDPGTIGHTQSWNGKTIGSGSIQIAALNQDARIEFDLAFRKPWKSRSQAGFRFEPVADGTLVTWSMRGSVPVFLFFLRKMMTAWVGSDYGRGLAMLKELLEDGAVASKVEVKTVVDCAPFRYFGIRHHCSIADIGPAMEADFSRLGALLADAKLSPPPQKLCLYHEFDPIKGRCDYTAAYSSAAPPDFDPSELGADFSSGQVPAHQALRVDHIGAYRHLGNAWAAAIGCARTHHRIDKSVPMYERYANTPEDTDAKDLRTEVHLPVKGRK